MRVSLLVSAYLQYTNIAAPAAASLDRFAMRRFSDEFGSGLSTPSHKRFRLPLPYQSTEGKERMYLRYLMYFSGLLSGAIRINSEPIFLHQVRLTAESPRDLLPYVKIYENLVLVYTSAALYLLSLPVPSLLTLHLLEGDGGAVLPAGLRGLGGAARGRHREGGGLRLRPPPLPRPDQHLRPLRPRRRPRRPQHPRLPQRRARLATPGSFLHSEAFAALASGPLSLEINLDMCRPIYKGHLIYRASVWGVGENSSLVREVIRQGP